MNIARIRGFLLQQPKPTVIRVTGEGEPQELKPGKSYAKMAETIAALGVDLVECLDAEGKLLRAIKLSTEQRSDAAAMPVGLETDPSALMLTHFANLIHRAYEHSTEIAFTKMVELFGMMGDRAESIESRLERTEARNRRLSEDAIDVALDRADDELAAKAAGGGDLLQQLANGFMSGHLQAAQTNGAAARPPANGKSKGQS